MKRKFEIKINNKTVVVEVDEITDSISSNEINIDNNEVAENTVDKDNLVEIDETVSDEESIEKPEEQMVEENTTDNISLDKEETKIEEYSESQNESNEDIENNPVNEDEIIDENSSKSVESD